ncbi:sulfite oxidase-like oxidoreductase [Candidatus Woesearchaeota archaeon]|nr:MAG: hypothetical protein QT09_C0012G0050 [archaeon GW2011_AR18]MBS3161362.1 sulfite oxidase-like oxidoreductase [Candidatus Woesearchaeota archaeon]HIH25394.1 sulfite oxidase-like oxidoreductase [Nanoarchaeota archaeon]
MKELDKLNVEFIKSKEKIAKLFKDKHSPNNKDSRLPPGQYLTDKFPVLDLGIQPDFDPKTWKLEVVGEVFENKVFTYNDILKMPRTDLSKDFTCVTKWTKYDVRWSGVLWKDFLKYIKVKPSAKAVMFYGADGYSTNNLLEDIENDTTLLAYLLDSKPIPKEHGWPMRVIIPHLYAWKGSKFLNKIEFMKENKPGFWEVRGYHLRGDANLEERYS